MAGHQALPAGIAHGLRRRRRGFDGRGCDGHARTGAPRRRRGRRSPGQPWAQPRTQRGLRRAGGGLRTCSLRLSHARRPASDDGSASDAAAAARVSAVAHGVLRSDSRATGLAPPGHLTPALDLLIQAMEINSRLPWKELDVMKPQQMAVAESVGTPDRGWRSGGQPSRRGRPPQLTRSSRTQPAAAKLSLVPEPEKRPAAHADPDRPAGPRIGPDARGGDRPPVRGRSRGHHAGPARAHVHRFGRSGRDRIPARPVPQARNTSSR